MLCELLGRRLAPSTVVSLVVLWAFGEAVLPRPVASAEPTSRESHPKLAQELLMHGARSFNERRFTDVLRAWYAHRHLIAAPKGENVSSRLLAFSSEFRSLAWGLVGEVGACPTELGQDEGAAGLWPIAVHNHILRTYRRRAPRKPPFFGGLRSFERGRQARELRFDSLPALSELKHLKIKSGTCGAHDLMPIPYTSLAKSRGRERRMALSQSLIETLREGRRTLNEKQVRGKEIVDARLVDLWTWQERQEAEERERAGSQRGASGSPEKRGTRRRSAEQLQVEEDLFQLSAAAWQQIEIERALRVYDVLEARLSLEKQRAILFALVNRSLQADDGLLLTRVLGRFDGPRSIFRGALHEEPLKGSILSLDISSGFRERGYFSFHQALEHERSDRIEAALRSFAFALRQAADSERQTEKVTSYSLQWVSYILSQYQVDGSMIRVLRQVLPREHYAPVWRELVWSAIFQLDAKAFDLLMQSRAGRGRASAELRKFRSYTQGKASLFLREMSGLLRNQPSQAQRLLAHFVENLERQSYEVRLRHRSTLRGILVLLERTAQNARRRQLRMSDETRTRIESIEAGFPESTNLIERDLSADAALSAGAIRLPPESSLPWPFQREVPLEADVFGPIGFRVLGQRSVDEPNTGETMDLVWTLEDR